MVQLACNGGLRHYDYDAFGNELAPNENDNNPLRYNGQYWDEETQTYYLRARQYNPITGRFTTEDSYWTVGNMIYDENGSISMEAILQAGNLYVYCMGNPVMFVDISGLEVTKDEPPTAEDGYIPPKGGAREGKTEKGEKGWVDSKGNIWVPIPDGHPAAHGGGHWDVNRPDGKGYVNRYPGGRERAGKGKRPNFPSQPQPQTQPQPQLQPIKQSSSDRGTIIGIIIIVGAIAFAPATGGSSLALV